MKNLLSVTILILQFATSVTSQDVCGFHQVKTEKELIGNGRYIDKSDECTQIRTAVHILHTGETSFHNISDAQVQSAIDGINAQFMNSGHKYDEENGLLGYTLYLDTITRINGNIFGTYTANGIDYGSGEGISMNAIRDHVYEHFSPYEYYNLYIYSFAFTNTGGTLLGWAWVGSPHLGAFIKYDRFGDTFYETESDNFQVYPVGTPNGTAIHEVGHTLGLWHTFQSTSGCPEEANCNLQGDRVCDTDPESLQYGCGLVCGHNSRNVMSYKSCKEVLTPGQVDRMLQVIANPGNGFSGYLICDSTGCPTYTGDFNGDGFINILDASLLGANYACGGDCYDVQMDSNCDGIINILDWSALAGVFGTEISNEEILLIAISYGMEVQHFDMMGRQIKEPQRGFYITRADGMVMKYYKE